MPYEAALRNVAHYLRSLTPAQRESGEALDVFQISAALAVAFCKRKEDIVVDILRVQGLV